MFKQAIVLRSDLKMGKGKLVAQGAHASIEAYGKAVKTDRLTVAAWRHSGAAKIALKVSSEEELKRLYGKAQRAGVSCALIRDAGRTQIPAGSPTAIAIGPASDQAIDKLTKDLKLL